MAIEFNCPHCDKLLKTSDEKAGRQAKCPGCGEIISVPASSSAPAHDAVFDAEPVPDQEPESDQPASVDETSDATKVCPACGETIRAAAIKCRYCGEVLDRRKLLSGRINGRREMRPFPPGEVISDAWRLYIDSLGIAFGASLIVLVLNAAVTFVAAIPGSLAEAMKNQGQEGMAALVTLMAMFLNLMSLVFQMYLHAGYSTFLLKIAREQTAELGDLFSGSRFLLRMCINSLVLGIFIIFGLLACVIPAIFVMVIFCPVWFVIVDQDLPGLDSLWRAKELTKGNLGSIFLLFLASFGITILGAMACYVGLLFTIPLVSVIFAVAYDRMTCQTPLDQIPNPQEDTFETLRKNREEH